MGLPSPLYLPIVIRHRQRGSRLVLVTRTSDFATGYRKSDLGSGLRITEPIFETHSPIYPFNH